ncbi:SDR family NAD(P)-dependent oxidoreductase [Streptomyces radicis]|uniref:3-dehydrosphinganine reductase n=1 Tax=Streptomyces radicis TaxID=1750517 RepID=A0A3A9VVG0_9ACTN|nr:SDR family NAD(P)-dependent oxidoreductase [Streptomyces radicis]RKN15946.1 SDR family NAD(P)-dependent oxidoreductase [Streptomyces radicis]
MFPRGKADGVAPRQRSWLRPGEHAIVTGGSSGIGLATAAALADRGAVVSLLARGSERLESAAAWLRRRGAVAVHTAVADVTDRAQVTRAVEGLVRAAGPCAVLVTSAGQSRPGRFLGLPDEAFTGLVEVDYLGTLWPIRAVVPQMVARGRGTVVTISSVAGLIGVPGYSAYGAAKFAVRGLSEVLRGELAPHRVRVACVFPPDVDTPQLAAERRWRPVETDAVSGTIAPLRPEVVAARILAGVDRGRPVICVDRIGGLLARFGGVLAPLLRRYVDHRVGGALLGAASGVRGSRRGAGRWRGGAGGSGRPARSHRARRGERGAAGGPRRRTRRESV